MKNTKRKIGFTLAELLVVVVVLAVLAGVAVPKFTRVLETRKTSEAEQMLSAVRMEQEKRCTLGKKYTDTNSKISVLASLNNMKSANYEYQLGGQGAQAQSRDTSHANYQLKMLSYRDGRICCDDANGGNGDCKKLNKDYEPCGDLLAKLSSSVDECALEPSRVEEDADCQGIAPKKTEMRDGCRWTLSYHCERGQWQPDAEWRKTDFCPGTACFAKDCPSHAHPVKTGDDCKCACDAGYIPTFADHSITELFSCIKKDDYEPEDDEPEVDTGNITCITSVVWSQINNPALSEHPQCLGSSSFYRESMPIDEWMDVHCSGAVGRLPYECSSGAECDCEPGEKYYQTGSCESKHEGSCTFSFGGYCFTCRRVNSTSQCASWSDMSTKQCDGSSNGAGNIYDRQPVDNSY